MKLPVYLDYNATTPVAPQVVGAIEPFLRAHFGNPSSSHVYGRRAHEAVEHAREQVARLIGAAPSEIVFTGCATKPTTSPFSGPVSCGPRAGTSSPPPSSIPRCWSPVYG